jgi:hypothetical protein
LSILPIPLSIGTIYLSIATIPLSIVPIYLSIVARERAREVLPRGGEGARRGLRRPGQRPTEAAGRASSISMIGMSETMG